MSQTYNGEVRNGVIVLDGGGPPLAEGTRVHVEPAELKAAVAELSQALLDFAGTVQGLPADMAEQHDHYLHGQPKR